MGIFSRKKNSADGQQVKKPQAKKVVAELEAELKNCADNFLNKNSIEVIIGGNRTKIPAIKWLYPGYGDYKIHAIIPNEFDKIATEIVNEPNFVNEFLHNRRDVNGIFGYFVARVEGNYVMMSDIGNSLFSGVRESDIDDYDTIVLMKQCNRLFPKFNKETFTIDFKHIEIFGEVFNKLKSKLSVNYNDLSDAQLRIVHIDIPTYTHSSIKIENSVESFNIIRLAEMLEKLSQDVNAVSASVFKTVIQNNIAGVEKVRDILHVSENSKRFNLPIENLEKVSNKLDQIKRVHSNLFVD